MPEKPSKRLLFSFQRPDFFVPRHFGRKVTLSTDTLTVNLFFQDSVTCSIYSSPPRGGLFDFAAPFIPQANPRCQAGKQKAPQAGPFGNKFRRRPTFPHSYPCSIIGAAGLNFCVRDGNRCDPCAIATENRTTGSAIALRHRCTTSWLLPIQVGGGGKPPPLPIKNFLWSSLTVD